MLTVKVSRGVTTAVIRILSALYLKVKGTERVTGGDPSLMLGFLSHSKSCPGDHRCSLLDTAPCYLGSCHQGPSEPRGLLPGADPPLPPPSKASCHKFPGIPKGQAGKGVGRDGQLPAGVDDG